MDPRARDAIGTALLLCVTLAAGGAALGAEAQGRPAAGRAAPREATERRAPPDIRVRVVRVSGGPRARIAAARRLVRDKREDLRQAFARGLRRAPEQGVSVMLDLDVDVGDDGRVRTVTAAAMPREASLRRAVDHVLRGMRRWHVEDGAAHGRFQVRLAFEERPLLRPHRAP